MSKSAFEMETLTCTHFSLAGRPATVTALAEGLKIEVPTKIKHNVLLAWADVLGANTTRQGSGLLSGVSDRMPLVVHTFEKARNGKRRASSIVLEVAKAVDQQDIDQWIKIIAYFANPMRPVATTAMPASIDDVLQNEPKKRKFLVLINPVSGQGKAEKLFKKVDSLFAHANIDVTKVLTDRAGHATDAATTFDYTTYDALVVVGGDGLAYEVVQGLMGRADWAAAIQSPLGILPAGGGNGLAKSLTEAAGETYCFENCAYLLLKGQSQPLDLASLRNKTETCYCFLSLSWAFMADVDSESEKYRFAGSQRFALAAVGKILSGKNWSGSFSYLEEMADDEPPQYWDAHAAGEAAAPTLSLLPPSPDDPTPKTWKTIEGDFSLFWAMNVAWAGEDGCVAPSADPNDGYMYAVIAPGKITKGDYMGLLLSVESGGHVQKPFVQVIKTRAFEVRVPESDLMMADGERFEGGFCQVEVHRGLGRVLRIAKEPTVAS
ncbi:Aste57867_17046 [Aphanomyces stellatus]|uniref:Aste57867_17046 protein n=1 Tax=Aphanomyces stellatus TaxID=120398 RepID=A0A485L818_9STRA|nr:hypothetical protein As57867_016988 [Aphanomyces stellatus]VFT93807.1 Aste57867_17046 [Aphanomyces stellatus]